jgi:hypothetical protein
VDRASCAVNVLDGRYASFGHGCLYGAKAASIHLDGFQSEIFVCDGLGTCMASGNHGGVGGSGVVAWDVVVCREAEVMSK